MSARALVLAGLIAALALPVEAEPLVVPYEDGYLPFSATLADGTPDGFNIAVAREVAALMGGEPVFVATDFDTIQFGDWPEDWAFSVASMSQSPARADEFLFVGPYYFDQVVLVARKGTGDFDAGRFDGKRFAVCQGCIYGLYIAGGASLSLDGAAVESPLGLVSILVYPSDLDVLRALGEADPPEADYGMTSIFHALYYESRDFPIEHGPTPVFTEPLWIVVPRGREAFAARVEAALDDLRLSGRLAELSRDYLGGDYTKAAGLPGQ